MFRQDSHLYSPIPCCRSGVCGRCLQTRRGEVLSGWGQFTCHTEGFLLALYLGLNSHVFPVIDSCWSFHNRFPLHDCAAVYEMQLLRWRELLRGASGTKGWEASVSTCRARCLNGGISSLCYWKGSLPLSFTWSYFRVSPREELFPPQVLC